MFSSISTTETATSTTYNQHLTDQDNSTTEKQSDDSHEEISTLGNAVLNSQSDDAQHAEVYDTKKASFDDDDKQSSDTQKNDTTNFDDDDKQSADSQENDRTNLCTTHADFSSPPVSHSVNWGIGTSTSSFDPYFQCKSQLQEVAQHAFRPLQQHTGLTKDEDWTDLTNLPSQPMQMPPDSYHTGGTADLQPYLVDIADPFEAYYVSEEDKKCLKKADIKLRSSFSQELKEATESRPILQRILIVVFHILTLGFVLHLRVYKKGALDRKIKGAICLGCGKTELNVSLIGSKLDQLNVIDIAQGKVTKLGTNHFRLKEQRELSRIRNKMRPPLQQLFDGIADKSILLQKQTGIDLEICTKFVFQYVINDIKTRHELFDDTTTTLIQTTKPEDMASMMKEKSAASLLKSIMEAKVEERLPALLNALRRATSEEKPLLLERLNKSSSTLKLEEALDFEINKETKDEVDLSEDIKQKIATYLADTAPDQSLQELSLEQELCNLMEKPRCDLKDTDKSHINELEEKLNEEKKHYKIATICAHVKDEVDILVEKITNDQCEKRKGIEKQLQDIQEQIMDDADSHQLNTMLEKARSNLKKATLSTTTHNVDTCLTLKPVIDHVILTMCKHIYQSEKPISMSVLSNMLDDMKSYGLVLPNGISAESARKQLFLKELEKTIDDQRKVALKSELTDKKMKQIVHIWTISPRLQTKFLDPKITTQ